MDNKPNYDVFICHASEDKEDYVDSLASALRDAGVSVWYDGFALEWGDTLRGRIDAGLADSSYGIVVLSPAFLKRKRWTEHELDGLFARESTGNKVILPIWHNITQDDLAAYSPSFVDRLAKNSTKDSIAGIVAEVKHVLAAAAAARPRRASERDWQEDVESYAASAVQVGGPGSRLVTKTAWLTSGEHAYLDDERFVLVAFPGGGTLMSLSPREGYEITGCSSFTGNKILDENYLPRRAILLEEKLQNSLLIYCKKKL
ncbi:MAG: toll/interleukin-1 receptor domain-containing protein [Acidobacteriota bacterium]|nr:toll/interleukin-1 receptor domain-containing protein [Acidobacteriota bacterium]